VLGGEIYKFMELKKRLLKKGYVFMAKSDAEILYWF